MIRLETIKFDNKILSELIPSSQYQSLIRDYVWTTLSNRRKYVMLQITLIIYNEKLNYIFFLDFFKLIKSRNPLL